MPRTEVTQHAWGRTVVIISQHPACYIRQEKCRRCGAFSLIISLDKSTSRRKEKKTTKNISDYSCDTTLRAKDLGLSGKLRSVLNLCCLSRRTQKSRITAMWLSAQTKLRLKNRRIWEALGMRLERKTERPPNTSQEQFRPIYCCLRCIQVHGY